MTISAIIDKVISRISPTSEALCILNFELKSHGSMNEIISTKKVKNEEEEVKGSPVTQLWSRRISSFKPSTTSKIIILLHIVSLNFVFGSASFTFMHKYCKSRAKEGWKMSLTKRKDNFSIFISRGDSFRCNVACHSLLKRHYMATSYRVIFFHVFILLEKIDNLLPWFFLSNSMSVVVVAETKSELDWR